VRDRILIGILGVSFALGAGDVATTAIGLNMGLGEGNPFMRAAYESYGSMGLVGVKAVAMCGTLTFPLMSKNTKLIFGLWVLTFATIHVYAIANNLALILF
jgi:hypothetical protein